MNWDRIEGNRKQFKGSAKQQWGKLTDHQLRGDRRHNVPAAIGHRDYFVRLR
jgi:hypothetical protein